MNKLFAFAFAALIPSLCSAQAQNKPRFKDASSFSAPAASAWIERASQVAKFGAMSENVGVLRLSTTGSMAKRRANARETRRVDVRDFGAVCDGQNSSDDGPAFQVAINAAADGTAILFPTGCYINTTINVTKSVLISGDGVGASVYIPNVTAFRVTANHVVFENFYAYGNRSESPLNMLAQTVNASWVTFLNLRAERLNSFVNVRAGVFGSIRNTQLRNLVSSCIHFENSTGDASGVSGVDYFINGLTYDTDGDWYPNGIYQSPAKACIWIQDYNAVNLNEFDLLHGGQVATVWINPQYSRSGDHRIGNGYIDINTRGDGLRIEPAAGTRADRIDVNSTWIATELNGVHLTGAGQIEGVNISNSRIYNQSQHGYLYDNTSVAPATNTIRSVIFSGNSGFVDGGFDDIKIIARNMSQSFSIVGNIFNLSSALSSNKPLHNVEANMGFVSMCGNDMALSRSTSNQVAIDSSLKEICDDFVTSTLPPRGYLTIPGQSGEMILTDVSTGNTCLYLLGGSSVALLGQSKGSTCVTGTTPQSDQIGLAYANGYKIYNGGGDPRIINYRVIRTHLAN